MIILRRYPYKIKNVRELKSTDFATSCESMLTCKQVASLVLVQMEDGVILLTDEKVHCSLCKVSIHKTAAYGQRKQTCIGGKNSS